MTYHQLVEYLRANSARCRSFADTASDAEAAEALREVAGRMESAIMALQVPEAKDVTPNPLGAR